MADKNKSGDFYNRPESKGGFDGCKSFLWNPETKQFMGRTSGSWGKILLFYCIFYIVLAAFFMGLWFLFATTLTDERPKYELKDSIIGDNPGLGFRPMPPESNVESTLVWYEMKNENNSAYWIKEIDSFLDEFKAKDDSKTVDCRNNDPGEKACKIDLAAFEPCTHRNGFGYEDGKPCIFLKLNKIYNWAPEYYSDSNLPEKMPKTLRDHIGSRAKDPKKLEVVWVSCEGENPADIENLGTKIYYKSMGGEQGFLGRYFPFRRTPGYLQPLVAVRFESIKPGVLINIECKAWAKNIKHDRQDRRGSVHFELMIDEPKKKA